MEFDVTKCTVTGELKEDKGKLSGKFEVDLRSLDTGLDLRNEHMRDKYLETDKFPNAVFELDPLEIGSKTFTGLMTLHGRSKKITGGFEGWLIIAPPRINDCGGKSILKTGQT